MRKGNKTYIEKEFEYKKVINGGLALGYGSKYQLLRMLVWHRHDFDNYIKEAVDLDFKIDWFDFHYRYRKDGEPLNLEFIPELDCKWKKYWSCGSNGLNWDAVGKMDNGTYILIEAKANIIELHSSIGGNEWSQGKNTSKIQKFLTKYKIETTARDFIENNYQLANRLVALNYLLQRGYKAKLVYVLFANGYSLNTEENKSVSEEEWSDIMNYEFTKLGIKGTKVKKLINVCIIDCKRTDYIENTSNDKYDF